MNMEGASYTDIYIIIKPIDDRLQCEWINRDVPINHSYMIAKLVEVITNKFPGTWPVEDIKEIETSKGLRCFIHEFHEDILTAKWI